MNANRGLNRAVIWASAFLPGIFLCGAIFVSVWENPGTNRVRDGAAKTQISAFCQALEMFRADVGRYPTSDEGLAGLVTCPTNIPSGHWRQYMDGIPLDPWSNTYVYHYPGIHNAKSFDIYSCGRDGLSRSNGNDPDDVNNWNPPPTQGPDYSGDMTGLRVFGCVFIVSIAALACISRMLRPSGNLHGLMAVSWLSGAVALGCAIELLKPPYETDWVRAFGPMSTLAVAAVLAVSGVWRGCRISKAYGAIVIILFLLGLLLPKLA
jgi:general secretion pathway protein G